MKSLADEEGQLTELRSAVDLSRLTVAAVSVSVTMVSVESDDRTVISDRWDNSTA